MICAHCRTQNPTGSRYCFNCGRDVSKSAPEPVLPKHDGLQEKPIDSANDMLTECWACAGKHLGKMGGARVSWLRAHLHPPFHEHLSFRLDNQLFFIRIVDADNRLSIPGTLEGLLSAANRCEGHACIMPMRRISGSWRPSLPGWGLEDAISRCLVDPPRLVTSRLIEMTDWELHDFASQAVRNQIKDDGKTVIAWQSDSLTEPSLWFSDKDGPAWVIVRAGRYPSIPSLPSLDLEGELENLSRLEAPGYFASVGVACMETVDKGNKLYRGAPLVVRFTGLEPIQNPGDVGRNADSPTQKPIPSIPKERGVGRGHSHRMSSRAFLYGLNPEQSLTALWKLLFNPFLQEKLGFERTLHWCEDLVETVTVRNKAEFSTLYKEMAELATPLLLGAPKLSMANPPWSMISLDLRLGMIPWITPGIFDNSLFMLLSTGKSVEKHFGDILPIAFVTSGGPGNSPDTAIRVCAPNGPARASAEHWLMRAYLWRREEGMHASVEDEEGRTFSKHRYTDRNGQEQHVFFDTTNSLGREEEDFLEFLNER